MNPKKYELDDFLSDESFQNWALNRATAEQRSFWNRWTETNPEKREIMEEAVKMITMFKTMEEDATPETIKASWEKVKTRIEAVPMPNSGTTLNGSRSGLNRYYKYAAAVALLIAVLAVLYTTLYSPSEPSYITYRSGYGSIEEVQLPDGSAVVLNANTELKVADDWNTGTREAWLVSGEAFFTITKKSDKASFVVHTARLDVTVLGTAFNVNLRQGATKVMLKEGKVNLQAHDGQSSLLAPGELAEYFPGKKLALRKVESVNYYNWMDGKIVFDNTPLQDIARFIEDYYGVHTDIENDAIRKRTLSGQLPNDSLQLLLNALGVTMDLKIVEEQGRIIIKE